MRYDVSSNQSAPTPRTNPLIVDHLGTDQLTKIRTYIESHGGVWTFLADDGYQVFFPSGTLQWLTGRDEGTETYTIQFPDTALLTWYRSGRISPVNGWPRQMSSRIALPMNP